MTPETAFRVVDFAFQSPAPSIKFEFQGGESLLNFPAVKSLYEYARLKQLACSKEVVFNIVTNLTLVTDEIADYLVKGGIGIATSVDGIAEVHDLCRPFASGRGLWEHVMQGIRKVEQVGGHVGCLVVVTHALLDRLPEVLDTYSALGIRRLFLAPVEKKGRAIECWHEIGLEMEEFLDSWRAFADLILERTENGSFFQERMLSLALHKVMHSADVGYMDFRSPCGMVTGQLGYAPNGDIYSCDEARGIERFRLGNVLTHGYSEVMASPRTREIVALSLNDDPECQTCAYKPYCGPCPVLSYTSGEGERPRPITGRNCRWHRGVLDYVFQQIVERPERIKTYLRAQELHRSLGIP